MACELITNEQVETAAEAAWANYMGYDARHVDDDDEDWEIKQKDRKSWPETYLHPDADAFRSCVRAGLRAIGFQVEDEPTP